MAPEQVEGGELDGRTDIYSLAAVAYEALTGKRVVEGHEVGRMMMDVLYGAAARVSSLIQVPEAVDKAFESALAKRPSDRPAFIEPWAEELAALLDALPQRDTPGWPSLRPPAPGTPSSSAGHSAQDETRAV
jgi:serine/threonine protein kinase